MPHTPFSEVSELRAGLDKKEYSSLELTLFYLNQIKSRDHSYNSFLSQTEELALKQAQKADEQIALGGDVPALCGIPYGNKDLFCVKDEVTTAASKILENYRPPYSATAIKKLDESFAVHLGKTNLDQFAHGSSTETSAFGPSKNPWDPSRIPGGSSGGSSAAVAAGLVPFTTATETGGSIRQPASLCGISGWKPTYGRVSRYGVAAMGSSLDSPGAMARSVRDLALIAEVMAGFDQRDGTTGNKPVPKYSQALNGDVKGVRVGVPKQYFVDGMEEGVRVAVMNAVEVLRGLGAEIVDVDLPNTRFGSLVYAIVAPSEIASNLSRYDGIRYGHSSSEAASLLDVYMKSRAEGFGDEAKRRIMTGTYVLSAGYYDAYYKKAQKVRRLIVNEFDEVFTKVDVLIAPSSPNVAVPLGLAASDPLFGYIADQLNIPSSLAGLPALSVPCGFATPSTGTVTREMPVGVQFMGPQWSEEKLFVVGDAFQRVTDWHKQTPELV